MPDPRTEDPIPLGRGEPVRPPPAIDDDGVGMAGVIGGLLATAIILGSMYFLSSGGPLTTTASNSMPSTTPPSR